MPDTVIPFAEPSPEPLAIALVESPPPSPSPARDASSAAGDPRTRLHELAAELVRTKNRRLLIEYLKLRRAVR